MRVARKQMKRESGIALLTTILLLLLMSSLLVGFVLVVSTGQKLGGTNNDYSKAFYAAEAGMEKLTADLGTLFNKNYAPTGSQIAAIQTTPPSLSGIRYVKYDGSTGYTITTTNPTDASGNPVATVTTIKSGPYQGMTALATPYLLNVTARTTAGSEVKLQRTTQTVGIPMFQFGVFCEGDCSFFPGPPFNFGGRTHTNGNLFLASGNTLTLSDRVTAVKDIIRTNLSNGFPTGTNYAGTVNVFNGSGTRPMAFNEGSLVGTVGSAANSNWPTISLGSSYYAGNMRNGTTGARVLNLGIVTLGSGSTQSIDIIRRPVQGESSSVTAERYIAQASVQILLSDNPLDITSLPCVDPTPPFDLSILAQPTAQWPTAGPAAVLKNLMQNNDIAGLSTTPVPLAASGSKPANFAASAYNPNDGYWLSTPQDYQIANSDTGVRPYKAGSGLPIIKGFLKIAIQTSYGTPCGTWKDVTVEVLGFGYAGRNMNPTPAPQTLGVGPTLKPGFTETAPGIWQNTAPINVGVYPCLPNAPKTACVAGVPNVWPLNPLPDTHQAATGVVTQAPPSRCPDVHPNAIIRLERVRDNPSTYAPPTAAKLYYEPCGVTLNAGGTVNAASVPQNPADYWPNTLYDAREGTMRDDVPGGTLVANKFYDTMTLISGSMQYVEIDMRNLTRYLAGALPGSGNLAFDAVTAPNDFSVYVSDRRNNYVNTSLPTSWPPLSPTRLESGEYGFEDSVNNANQFACPNSSIDSGEDLDGVGSATLFTYGQDAKHAMAYTTGVPFTPNTIGFGQYLAYPLGQMIGSGATNFAYTPNPNCISAPLTPTTIWPGAYTIHANEARENPAFFFRRAVKLFNGSDLSNLPLCPGAIRCGLTVTSENPVYIQGDYNCPNNCAGNVFNDNGHVATSVIADAVTLLSNNWNDVNSFTMPFSQAYRNGVTTYYRTAIVAGKGISFQQPTGYATSQDFGTDGGIHNFLRYIENWGGQTLNYRGSIISLYYNRQATGVFKCCTIVYSPPSRGYNFDVEFLTPNLLPPRTPLFRDVNTTGFTELLLPTQ